LNQFVFLLLLTVGLIVAYYSMKDRGSDLLKKVVPGLVKPDGR
jgi:hypothetical protein